MNVKELLLRKGKKLKLVVIGVWSVVWKTTTSQLWHITVWLTKGLY